MMRKSLLFIVILAAFVACHKEPVNPDDKPDTPVEKPEEPTGPTEVIFDGACSVYASFAEAIVDGVPAWAEGDKVKLFGAENATAELTLASQTGGKAARRSFPARPR